MKRGRVAAFATACLPGQTAARTGCSPRGKKIGGQKGGPCQRGQTAARSGCTPKAKGSAVSRDKAAGFKRALTKTGSKKAWRELEGDINQREDTARQGQLALEEQLAGIEAQIAGVETDKPRRPATGPLASKRISDDTLRAIAKHEGLDHREPNWFDKVDPTVIQEARMGAIKGKGSSSLSTLLRQRAALMRQRKEAERDLASIGAEREKRLGVPFSRFAAARESVRGARGQPCRQGQTAARTGCTPKAKGQAVNREKAARFKAALTAAKGRAKAAESRIAELEAELGGGKAKPEATKAASVPAPAAKASGTHQDGKPAEHWGSKDQPFWRPGPNPTVDMVLTRKGAGGEDEVLLIQRGHGGAEAGKWALPGGFVDTTAPKGQPHASGQAEAPEAAALRELQEETGLDASTLQARMREVGAFDTRGRDPRDNDEAWATSTAFHLDVTDLAGSGKVQGMDDAMAARWVPVSQLGGMDLAFDHGDILAKAGVGSAAQPSVPKAPRKRGAGRLRKGGRKAKAPAPAAPPAPAPERSAPDLGSQIVEHVTSEIREGSWPTTRSTSGWDRMQGGMPLADVAQRLGVEDMGAFRKAILKASVGVDAPLALTSWNGSLHELERLPGREAIIASDRDGRMVEGYSAIVANLKRMSNDPERLSSPWIWVGVRPNPNRRAQGQGAFAANRLRALFARRR